MDGAATLDTIIVRTHAIEAMARFYRAGLGVDTPIQRDERHLGFAVGQVYLGFDDVSEQGPLQRGAVTMWFRVDDLQAAFDRFVSMGAGVALPPSERPWGDRLACVLDPDGNPVGLAQQR